MLEKKTRVEILAQMNVGAETARVGSVVEMTDTEATRQKAMGRAKDAAPGAKVHWVTKEEAAAAAKANAAPPVRGSQSRDPVERQTRG
jgi:hypothetical protein